MRFDRKQFSYHGGYLTYPVDGKQRFVARFKYSFAKRGKADFMKFLIANFGVAEYFAAHDSGLAPLQILDTKGYDSVGRATARILKAVAQRAAQA